MTYRVPETSLVLRKVSKSKRSYPEPTSEDVIALWQAMSAKYNVTIVDKNNSEEMQAVANGLDVLGILDKERFLRDFVTTIGDKIYAPFTPGVVTWPWDLWQQTIVIAHECHHVVEQDRRQEGLLFNFDYASNSTKRAYYEMEAYRVNMTLEYIFHNTLLDPGSLANMLKDYDCNDEDIRMVKGMLTLSLVSIKKGAVPSSVCQFERDWLMARWAA